MLVFLLIGIALAVHWFDRGGRSIGFWREEARALEAGDVVVEVVPTPQAG